MASEELAYCSATELVELIAAGQISPVELTELYYERIDRLDPQLNSYLLLTRDSAMEAAAKAEAAVVRGDELGPLHGLPIPIKDTSNTAGIRTTMGSLLFKDNVPERDAAVVERVKGAGAIILGKTNAPEQGMVGTCENRLGEPGRNPWDTDRTPGGSSGGAAAAVAAYLCPVATGSDGGGSIRIPANFCGVYGIKPTQGRVSGYTGIDGPPMPYIFSQNGPIARTVRDAATLLQVMAGHDRRDPVSLRERPPDFVGAVDKDIDGLRIAWSQDFGFADVDPDVREVTSKAAMAFEELGCSVEETDLAMDEPYDAFGPLHAADSYASIGRYLETHADLLTDYGRFFLEIGSRVTAADYARGLGPHQRVEGEDDRPVRGVRPAALADGVLPGLPEREVSGAHQGRVEVPRAVLERGLNAAHQRHRASGRDGPGGLLDGRPAHRAAHRRKVGRRGDGAGGVCRLRARKALDRSQAACFLRLATL